MIKDLFSHKIHSSNSNWPEKLIELAFIFQEFDSQPYDRLKIEKRLQEISPRASIVARDPSKYRDEISAYPSYLGLYRIELLNDIWVFRLSSTAKRFLVIEEPDVASFLLLQLVLFQYPNGMGISYYPNTRNLRIQANSWSRTEEFIKNDIHLSPLRLICQAIRADSILDSKLLIDANVTFEEIFALANSRIIFQNSLPKLDDVIKILADFRNGKIPRPSKYERRFHLLKHTGLFSLSKGTIALNKSNDELSENEVVERIKCICQINNQFDGFDKVKSKDDFLEVIQSGSWGRFFDGVTSLSNEEVMTLTSSDQYFNFEQKISTDSSVLTRKVPSIPVRTYPFRERNTEDITIIGNKDPRSKNKADPEVTQIKRQKSNLVHKILLQRLDEYLIDKGIETAENEHIDLYAKIPGDGKYLFEVKSLTDRNLLSQARKGISQLYEYRFRYKERIGYDVNLCLVFPYDPTLIPWLKEYIIADRNIGILWFNENNEIVYPPICESLIGPLINFEKGR